jgi:hypothetical protein
MTDEPDQPNLFDPAAAKAAKDEAMKRVEDHASPEWLAFAKKMLRSVAETMPEFTTDDLVRSGLTKPREPRAFGPIMLWGAKRNIIMKTDRMRKSTQVTNHMRPLAIWQSRIYKPPAKEDTPW